MPDSREGEPLAPGWPPDDPRWRFVQEGTAGIVVDGQPVRPFRPEDFPNPDEGDYPDRL